MTENSRLKIIGILIIFLAVEIFQCLIGTGADITDRRVLFGTLSAVRQVITLNLVVFLFLGIFYKVWQLGKTVTVTTWHWFLPWAAISAAASLIMWVNKRFLGDSTAGDVLLIVCVVIYFVFWLVPLFGLLRGLEKNFQLNWKNKKPLILVVAIIVIQVLAAEGMKKIFEMM